MLEIIKQPRSDIPAVTHIDYSARVQTVEKEYHKKFYEIIKSFEDLTGCAVIINTSFNVRGEPIVNSPMDAFACFMDTEMDILLLEDFILHKKNQKKEKYKKRKNNLINNYTYKDNKIINKKLKKLYKNYLIINDKIKNKIFENVKNNKDSCWSDSNNSKSLDEIFLIEKDLDTKISVPQKMTKSIIKSWKHENLREIFEPLLVNLLVMANKLPTEGQNINDKVSDTIYEMF